MERFARRVLSRAHTHRHTHTGARPSTLSRPCTSLTVGVSAATAGRMAAAGIAGVQVARLARSIKVSPTRPLVFPRTPGGFVLIKGPELQAKMAFAVIAVAGRWSLRRFHGAAVAAASCAREVRRIR